MTTFIFEWIQYRYISEKPCISTTISTQQNIITFREIKIKQESNQGENLTT